MAEGENQPPKKCIFRISLDMEKQRSALTPPGYQDAGCRLCGGYLFSCKYYTPYSKLSEQGGDLDRFRENGPMQHGNMNSNGGNFA